MDNIKPSILSLLLITALASTDAIADGIPVFDVANSLNFVQSLANEVRQINTLQQQINNTTGTRGLGGLAAPGAVNNLPNSWATMLQQVQTSNGNFGQLVSSIVGTNAVLTPEQIAKMSPADQSLLFRTRNLGAMQQAMATTTSQVAIGQMQEIQGLQSQIDTANDPKAIADLTAALSAKSLELANTQNQIAAMNQQIEGERRAIEQQRDETNFAASRQPGSIHIAP